MEKLLEYQVPHTQNLIKSMQTYNRALDASDTGTGKSYTAIAMCLALKLKPLIICPKSILNGWQTVLNTFNAEYYGITNYESLQNCKYFIKNEKVYCPYIKRITIKNQKEQTEYLYFWQNLPKDIVLIFDEAHRCKNAKTLNHLLLFTAATTPVKILLLSATVSDKPENFVLAGFVLGLYKSIKNAQNWINSIGNGYDNIMTGVHKALYPDYASRMKIRDLGSLFPDNQILAECYEMDYANEIEEQYKIIEAEVEKLKKKEENSGSVLAKILYARMRIEQLKIPTFIEMANKYLEEGSSVAIFVNFTATLKTIAEELKTTCLIYGEQQIEERNKNINNFNDDTSHIIIANIRSGGTGVSLHDLNGTYPRVSIISPSWSAQDIIQALGRVHRANGKTPVRQRIIFCKGTVEETICKNMKDKIKNIAELNDGDTLGYQIKGLMEDNKINKDPEISEFERIFQRINVLNAKKERLTKELDETNNEIKTLELTINSFLY